MALLGYGASGSFLSSFPGFLNPKAPHTLALAAWLFSVSALLAYVLSNHIPFDIARISWDRWQILYVFLYYLLFSLPFFFSGLALASALARWSSLAGKFYFVDLSGAALGCLLVLFLFAFLGGPGTLLFSCLLAGVASLALGWGRVKNSFFPLLQWAWIGLLCFFLLGSASFLELASFAL